MMIEKPKLNISWLIADAIKALEESKLKQEEKQNDKRKRTRKLG